MVVAREKGPAWWRVSDEDTTVYILALPDGQLPPDLVWDKAGLERRVKGGNALLSGTQSYRLSLRDIPLLFQLRRSLRTKGEMEDDLPEPLKGRFVAAREKAGKEAKRYAGWGPMAAGFLLLFDTRTGPRWKDAEDQVRASARKLKVRETKAAARSGAPVIREFKAGLTDEVQQGCLAAALDDVEAGRGPATEAAQGWARGDARAALSGPRGFEKCLLLVAGGPQVWRNAVNDQAIAIAAALKQPGKAVATVRLRQLIAAGGVIETLEGMGLEVEGPAQR